jgi:hypothetical protein
MQFRWVGGTDPGPDLVQPPVVEHAAGGSGGDVLKHIADRLRQPLGLQHDDVAEPAVVGVVDGVSEVVQAVHEGGRLVVVEPFVPAGGVELAPADLRLVGRAEPTRDRSPPHAERLAHLRQGGGLGEPLTQAGDAGAGMVVDLDVTDEQLGNAAKSASAAGSCVSGLPLAPSDRSRRNAPSSGGSRSSRLRSSCSSLR